MSGLALVFAASVAMATPPASDSSIALALGLFDGAGDTPLAPGGQAVLEANPPQPLDAGVIAAVRAACHPGTVPPKVSTLGDSWRIEVALICPDEHGSPRANKAIVLVTRGQVQGLTLLP